jgi:tRNA 2-selenouridine synthase
LTFRVIAGATGSGKTRLLRALAACGAQVLDLEALAVHRGSVLGAVGPQPTQKSFDSQLMVALDGLDPDKPVWVEAESNRVGDVFLPPALWARMRAAEGVELRVPPGERVRYLIEEYAPLRADPEALKEKLRQFVARHGPRQIGAWCEWVDAGAWDALVASLLAVHYDPAYAASSRRSFPHVARAVSVPDATHSTLTELAGRLHSAPAGPASLNRTVFEGLSELTPY